MPNPQKMEREGGDLNPRALSSIGSLPRKCEIAIQRLAWLGHLRLRALTRRTCLKCFLVGHTLASQHPRTNVILMRHAGCSPPRGRPRMHQIAMPSCALRPTQEAFRGPMFWMLGRNPHIWRRCREKRATCVSAWRNSCISERLNTRPRLRETTSNTGRVWVLRSGRLAFYDRPIFQTCVQRWGIEISVRRTCSLVSDAR